MMLEHMGTAMRATDTVTSLLEDNMTMLTSLTKGDICRFVDVYRRSQMPRFVNLLGRICVCKGQPMGRIVKQTMSGPHETIYIGGNALFHVNPPNHRFYPTPRRQRARVSKLGSFTLA